MKNLLEYKQDYLLLRNKNSILIGDETRNELASLKIESETPLILATSGTTIISSEPYEDNMGCSKETYEYIKGVIEEFNKKVIEFLVVKLKFLKMRGNPWNLNMPNKSIGTWIAFKDSGMGSELVFVSLYNGTLKEVVFKDDRINYFMGYGRKSRAGLKIMDLLLQRKDLTFKMLPSDFNFENLRETTRDYIKELAEKLRIWDY